MAIGLVEHRSVSYGAFRDKTHIVDEHQDVGDKLVGDHLSRVKIDCLADIALSERDETTEFTHG